jgi:hypothetical protein
MSSGHGEEDVEAGGPRLPSFSFASLNLDAGDDEEEESDQVFDVHVATEHKSDPPGSAADRAAPASPPSSRGQAFMLGDELPLEDDGRDEDSDDSEDLSDDEDECCGGGSGKKSKAKVEVYQGTSIKQCGGRGVSSGRDRGVFYMTLSLIILPALVFYSCLYAPPNCYLLLLIIYFVISFIWHF